MRKIESGFEHNMKHAENISKFSRRNVNCFLTKNPKISEEFFKPKTSKKPKKKKTQKKTKSVCPSIPSSKFHDLPKNVENNPENPPNIEILPRNIEPTAEDQSKRNENEGKTIELQDLSSIAESKALEELLRKQDNKTNLDIKQSNLMISERIEMNGNLPQTGILNPDTPSLPITLEKSVNID